MMIKLFFDEHAKEVTQTTSSEEQEQEQTKEQEKMKVLLSAIDTIYDEFYNAPFVNVVPTSIKDEDEPENPTPVPGLFYNAKDPYRIELTDLDIYNGYSRAKDIMIYDILLWVK